LRRWRRALAAGVGAVVLGATLASSAPGTAQRPVRILLVGDSVTQGSAGDWTWRYRLWRQLVGTGVRVDLVGPRDDLFDNVTGLFGSHAYLDPAFDQDHAARWGMLFAGQDEPIGNLVDEFHPDVVVELLGVNDLAWNHALSGEVEQLARGFVTDARAADPDVDVVLGALPQTWIRGVPEYDAGLATLAEELDTDSSRVVTATPAAPFVEGTDTWDAAHPTASGEVKVAAGVTDALAGLGIGWEYPRPLPDVPLGPRIPAQLSATPGDGEAELSWVSPPGATAEYVWVRDTTTGQPWTRLPDPVTGSSWTAGGLVDGHVFELRLQAAKGSVAAEDLYSNVVTVRPGPAP
jgi:lysophospholipase L1-like esterase